MVKVRNIPISDIEKAGSRSRTSSASAIISDFSAGIRSQQPGTSETGGTHVQKNNAEDKTADIRTKKKVKKTKRKSRKKNTKEVTQQRDETLHQQSALNYLKTWKEKRNNWKFEKLKQIWLLKNPFDRDRIPDSSFQTFAEYIAAAKGRARDDIEQRATKIVEAMDERLELQAKGMKEAEVAQKHPELQVDKNWYLRARTLLVCLQDVSE